MRRHRKVTGEQISFGRGPPGPARSILSGEHVAVSSCLCLCVRLSIHYAPAGEEAAHSDVKTALGGPSAPVRGSAWGQTMAEGRQGFPLKLDLRECIYQPAGPGSLPTFPAQPASPLEARGSQLATSTLGWMSYLSSCLSPGPEAAGIGPFLFPPCFHLSRPFWQTLMAALQEKLGSPVWALGPRPWAQGQMPWRDMPLASAQVVICLLQPHHPLFQT